MERNNHEFSNRCNQIGAAAGQDVVRCVADCNDYVDDFHSQEVAGWQEPNEQITKAGFCGQANNSADQTGNICTDTRT
ncbi:MAG: hypothetical protein LIO92_09465 [Clostridiales bacterium]|nr:hypothetical protein [Clostridiales bacterium]